MVKTSTKFLAAGAIALAMASGAHHAMLTSSDAPSASAARAIAYARAQLGCPYAWGGTGPCSAGFDCSGLVMMAYRAAGIRIERTSEDQWASLPHVDASRREAGDLVFAPGSDGTWASPGHVGILLSRDIVEQAFMSGRPINEVSLSNFAANAGGIVGFAAVP